MFSCKKSNQKPLRSDVSKLLRSDVLGPQHQKAIWVTRVGAGMTLPSKRCSKKTPDANKIVFSGDGQKGSTSFMFARELHDNLNDPMNVFHGLSWVLCRYSFFAFEVTDFFMDFLAPIHYLDAFAQNTGPGQGAYCIIGCSRVSSFKRSWSNLQP